MKKLVLALILAGGSAIAEDKTPLDAGCLHLMTYSMNPDFYDPEVRIYFDTAFDLVGGSIPERYQAEIGFKYAENCQADLTQSVRDVLKKTTDHYRELAASDGEG